MNPTQNAELQLAIAKDPKLQEDAKKIGNAYLIGCCCCLCTGCLSWIPYCFCYSDEKAELAKKVLEVQSGQNKN